MGAVGTTDVATFLASATECPAALVIEGEAGIGKTTLWLAGVEQARERGFRVLSAQPSAAESVQAYASLADLLAGVDPARLGGLPEPQRLAIDQVLLRTDSDTPATDQRAVAAAFLSVIKRLADETPVLLAIDDLQWLDPSSVNVVDIRGAAAAGPVGVLGAERTDRASARRVVAAVAPPRRHATHPGAAVEPWRAARGPLRAAGPDISATDHESHPGDLGRKPFLCNRIGARTARVTQRSPRQRCRAPWPSWCEPESVASTPRCKRRCSPPPAPPPQRWNSSRAPLSTTPPTSSPCSRRPRATESSGSDGRTVRFAHPLLAQGVYANASPAQRRRMHRRLADIVEQPELQARHLALATTTCDPATLRVAGCRRRDRPSPRRAGCRGRVTRPGDRTRR